MLSQSWWRQHSGCAANSRLAVPCWQPPRVLNVERGPHAQHVAAAAAARHDIDTILALHKQQRRQQQEKQGIARWRCLSAVFYIVGQSCCCFKCRKHGASPHAANCEHSPKCMQLPHSAASWTSCACMMWQANSAGLVSCQSCAILPSLHASSLFLLAQTQQWRMVQHCLQVRSHASTV